MILHFKVVEQLIPVFWPQLLFLHFKSTDYTLPQATVPQMFEKLQQLFVLSKAFRCLKYHLYKAFSYLKNHLNEAFLCLKHHLHKAFRCLKHHLLTQSIPLPETPFTQSIPLPETQFTQSCASAASLCQCKRSCGETQWNTLVQCGLHGEVNAVLFSFFSPLLL